MTIARCCATALLAATACTAAAAEVPAQATLERTIAALDTAVFDAFNHCAEPAQLAKHAAFFAPGVEFYHDTGGVTWTRDAMIANTAKYACGHYTRGLLEGSMRVYPVKDFGAISQGVHRFCQVESGRCEGEADFAIVWHLRDDGQWEITRVLSYGHRPNPSTP